MIIIQNNELVFAGRCYRCAIGKGGFSLDKKEGDSATPLGRFALRECWYRGDKIDAPTTQLPLRVIQPHDGWCDDTKSPNYNRHIILPFEYSHEKLWRDDDVYDLIVPLGYNDNPVVSGKGSAIFMHVAKPDYTPTEGCVALRKQDLLEIIALCDADTFMEIRPD